MYSPLLFSTHDFITNQKITQYKYLILSFMLKLISDL